MNVWSSIKNDPRSSTQFLLLLISVLCMSTAISGLLPILPIIVGRLTTNSSQVGLVTATVSLGTVMLELSTHRLIRSWTPAKVLAGGFALAGLALGGFALVGSFVIMIALGAVFGVGFGIVVSATSAFVGEVMPSAHRARAYGLYGLTAGAPAVVMPSIALTLLSTAGAGVVFVLLAVTCLVGLVTTVRLRLPKLDRNTAISMRAAFRRPRLVTVLLAYFCAMTTFGGVISYSTFVIKGNGLGSAAIFFLVFGFSRIVSRGVAGSLLDRMDERWVTLPGIGLSCLGLILIPIGGAPLVISAGALYGLGLGAMQTSALVAMLNRVPKPDSVLASGLWNFAVDAGITFSALVLPPIAAAVGYRTTFFLMPALLLCALVTRVVESLWAGQPRDAGSAVVH